MWIYLFQDNLAALALTMDPPAYHVLDRKPDPKTAPLPSITMWKLILGQSVYQLAVTFTLYFGGPTILSYHTAYEMGQLKTMVFNTYVWMQIFNMYRYVSLREKLDNILLKSNSSRQVDNKLNSFEGVQYNWLLITLSLIMSGGQVLIMFFGGKTFAVTSIDRAHWGISLVLGALSIPIGFMLRLIPDSVLPDRLW